MRIRSDEKDHHIRFLPSTSLGQTYAISTAGCPESLNNYTFYKNYTCNKSRGNLYKGSGALKQMAKTGEAYGVDLSGFSVFKNYGFQNINATFWPEALALNTTSGSETSTTVINDVTVGLISETQFTWMNLLGLDSKPTMHTGPSNSKQAKSGAVLEQKSLLQTMKDANNIPSLSWAYHAGSYSRKFNVILLLHCS
jgi:hypothetical protein